MTRKTRPEGRTSIGGTPIGAPSDDELETRAREIARMDHPDDNEIRLTDRMRARQELTGENEEPKST